MILFEGPSTHKQHLELMLEAYQYKPGSHRVDMDTSIAVDLVQSCVPDDQTYTQQHNYKQSGQLHMHSCVVLTQVCTDYCGKYQEKNAHFPQ